MNFPHGLSDKTVTFRTIRSKRHVRYISVDDPDHALRFGRFLIQHANDLGHFPERGRVVPEFDEKSIREIIVREYRIIYRLDQKRREIEIIRFWHAARGIPELTLLN